MPGTCDPRFAAVADAMRENVASRGDIGAAVAVIVDGRLVVDVWDGWADPARTRPWARETVVNVFSVGKALAALCLLRQVAAGRVELDTPVARYWPELGAATVTVRDLLAHRSGLAALSGPLPEGTVFDWGAVVAALAEQEPWWTPGEAHGYHVHTFGFLVGELVRRVTGETIGRTLALEVAAPLGAEVWFGLPPAERARRAEFVFDLQMLERGPARAPVDAHVAALRRCAYAEPPGANGVGTVNSAAWLDAELPSANAHATARGVAQVYAGLLDGRLLDAATLAEATREASAGEDLVLGRPSRFGLGFQLTQPERPLGPNARSFGHFGAGGALGFADPDAGVALGYVMNHGGPGWRNPRNKALVDAVYDALGR